MISALTRLLLLTGGALACAPLAAQEFPTKPIRLVVPFAQGGTADTLGRLVSDRMVKKLGQPIVVENRGGAGGILGSDLVAKAAPDGYTLIVSGIASHVVAPFMSPAPFDPLQSFSHIALFGGAAVGLLVHPSVEARNIVDFITMVKARPSGVSYASAGVGTHSHLFGEMFRMRTGANLVHVPYKGGGQAVADVVGGHVLSSFIGVPAAAAQAKAGKARFLAVTSARRLSEFPDVPTFLELGERDMVAITWFGLSGPAGMPRGIVNRLNGEVRAALVTPEVAKRLQTEGIEPNDLDAAAYTAFVRAEVERWGPLAKALK